MPFNKLHAFEALTDVAVAHELTLVELLVLTAILRATDSATGKTIKKLKTIARDIGHERTNHVYKARSVLIKKGLISNLDTSYGGEHYQINFPKDEKVVSPESGLVPNRDQSLIGTKLSPESGPKLVPDRDLTIRKILVIDPSHLSKETAAAQPAAGAAPLVNGASAAKGGRAGNAADLVSSIAVGSAGPASGSAGVEAATATGPNRPGPRRPGQKATGRNRTGATRAVPADAKAKRYSGKVLTEAQHATRNAFVDWWTNQAFPAAMHGEVYPFDGPSDAHAVLKLLRHASIAWDLAKAKSTATAYLNAPDPFIARQGRPIGLLARNLTTWIVHANLDSRGVRTHANGKNHHAFRQRDAGGARAGEYPQAGGVLAALAARSEERARRAAEEMARRAAEAARGDEGGILAAVAARGDARASSE